MCLSFTPPLSAAATAAAATAAAGFAAAPSLARRRYLLGQVRSYPGGAEGARRAAEPLSVAPPGGFHSGRGWPGGSMCVLGQLPASRWGSILLTTLTFYTAYQCLRVKTLPLATFGCAGRPWDREGVGARHAVGSGRGTSSRAWHRQTRLPKAGAEAPSWGWGGVGREKEVTFWQASPSPPP